jgi:hypothetical protein
MQSGELTVTGKNSIHIPLEHLPAEVKVYFKDDCEVVPCNPHHVDRLEYEVHTNNKHHMHFMLIVKWDVSDVREIVWHVSF